MDGDRPRRRHRATPPRQRAAAAAWKRTGARNPGEWLAGQTGTTATKARDDLATARRLRDLPDTTEATRRRIHAARRLKRFATDDGLRHLLASGPADVLAGIDAAMKPFLDRLFAADRAAGNRSTFEVRAFDALAAMAAAAHPTPPPAAPASPATGPDPSGGPAGPGHRPWRPGTGRAEPGPRRPQARRAERRHDR